MINTAYALAPARPALTVYPAGSIQPFTEDLFTRFIDYTDRKATTIKGYITCIKQFAKWMADNGITQPQREDIKAYRDHLAKSDLAAGTQAQYLRAVKHFFKWCASEGLYPNVADNIHGAQIKHDNHKKDALRREDVAKIAGTIETGTEAGRRLYAMYLLCVVCGLRTIEIHRANVEDLNTVDNITYLYLQGKGHDDKDAPVMLIPEVKAAVDSYLQIRSEKPTPKSPLFTSTSNRSKGGRIATTTISTMLKEMLIKAGYDSKKLTAHSLRHTSGSGAKKAGIDLYGIQHLMRHCDPKTSEIYIHDDDHEKDEARGRKAIYNYYFRDKLYPLVPELEAFLTTMSTDDQRKLLAQLQAAQKGA